MNMVDSSFMKSHPEIIGVNNVISPRIVFDYIYYLFLKIGVRYELAYLVMCIVTMVLYSIAIVNLIAAFNFNKSILFSILLAITLSKYHPIIDMPFGFNYAVSYAYLGFATAIEIIGIACIINNPSSVLKSLTIASIGLLFHIHEGIYGGALIFLIHLIYSYRIRKLEKSIWIAIVIWVSVLLAVALPNILTDKTVIPNDLFCEYYKENIIHFKFIPAIILRYLLFITCIAFLSCKFRINNFIKENYEYIIYLVIPFLIIIFIYIFIEKYPQSFCFTLYPQKSLKYFYIIYLCLFFKYFDCIIQGNYFVADVIILSCLLIVPERSVELFFLYVIVKSISFSAFQDYIVWLLAIVMLLFTFVLVLEEITLQNSIYILPIVCLLPFYNLFKMPRMAKYSIITMCCLFLFTVFSMRINEKIKNIIYGVDLDNISNYNLFKKYGELSKPEDVFVNSSKLNYEQAACSMVSHRAAYVEKDPPSTKFGTNINIIRSKQICNWDSLSLIKKNELAKNLNIQYILISVQDLEPNFPVICKNEELAFIKVK